VSRAHLPPCPWPEKDYDVRLSYSRATQARKCPWSAYKVPVEADEDGSDEVEGFVGPAAERGRFVHNVFARYAGYCHEHKVASDLDALNRIFQECLEEYLPSWEVMETVTDIISTFGSDHEFPLLKPGVKWGIEEAIWWMVQGDGVRVAVLSIIDRYEVEGAGAKLWDYKSGFRLPSREWFENDVQLPMYADALLSRYPKVKHIEAELDFPAISGHMQKRAGITVTEIRRAEMLLIETGAMLKAGYKRIADGAEPWEAFEPRPGKPCQPFTGVLCPKILDCPYVKLLSQDAIIRDDDDCRKQFSDVLWLDTMRKAKWAAVAEYVTGMQGVIVNGKAARCQPKMVKNFDMKRVIQYLTDRGLDLADCLTLDTGKKELVNDMIVAGVVKVHNEPEPKIINDDSGEKKPKR